jgi:hypothetical protein
LPKNDLQLVGVVSLWVASKIEEILPSPVSDFAMATDSGCSTQDMIDMEKKLIATLQWKTVPPTAHAWANLYLHCLLVDVRMRNVVVGRDTSLWTQPSIVPHAQINRVMEVLDFAMLDADSLCFYPSQLAAAAIALLLSRDTNNTYTLVDLERVSRVSGVDLHNCMSWMGFVLHLPSHTNDRLPRGSLTIEPHTVQRHNPKALALYQASLSARMGARDVAPRPEMCERQLRILRARAESEADNNELRDLNSSSDQDDRARATSPRDIADDRLRAFSPVTTISHLLSSAQLRGAGGGGATTQLRIARDAADVDASPRRA